MPREKENYRYILTDIRQRYGDISTLTIAEAAEYLRCDRGTLLKDKTFPAKKISGKYTVNAAALACWLS